MAATAGSAAGKRSWQGTQRPSFDANARHMWRWLLSLLAITLVAAAIWYLINAFDIPPKTLLISVTADREELGTVPPVPMLERDEQALKDWAQATEVPVHFAKLKGLRPVDEFCRKLGSDEEQPRFETVTADGTLRPSNKSLRKQDTLIIYIRAHGLAMIEGKDPQAKPTPFLVTSFQGLANISQSNSISVNELFANLAKLADVKKLVIIDAVHFNYDPRIGQLVNQFPSAVAQAFPVNAKNLWVILPGETGELSVVAPQQQQTLFSTALFSGLRAEDTKTARTSLPKLVEQIRDRYALARSDEADLSFWQKLQMLPTAEVASQGKLPDPTGTAIIFPTIPAPKKGKGEPAPEAKEPAEKKTAAGSKLRLPLGVGLNGQLALALQQPSDAPASPADDPAKPASEAPQATADPTAPAAAPMPPVVAPPVAPSPAPPAAAPAPSPADEKPRHSPFLSEFTQQLAEAWMLRDELENWESTFGRQGWSPVHFAPHHWRKLNAFLISYEERCRAGAVNDNRQLLLDLQQLIDGMRYLKRLLQQEVEPSNQGTGVVQDLSDAWYRLRSNGSVGPSKAWLSFQAAEKNSLHDANRALKIYADTAYRFPEYVRLQGIMLSAADVKLAIGTELENCELQLKEMRASFERQSEDHQMRPNIARDLLAQAAEVQRARQALDNKLSRFGQSLTSNRSVALPGRAQAIGLLLESPLIAAADRATLLDRVLPLLDPPASPATSLRPVASSGSGELIWDHLFDQVGSEVRVIKLLTAQDRPASRPDESLIGSAKYCLGRLNELTGTGAQPHSTASALGYEFREFYSQLPPRIMDRNRSLTNSSQGITRRQLLDLYHWLLLVDGRDAYRLRGLPVFLTQPFLPEPMPDSVKITVTPNPVQLTDKEQPVQVTIDVSTDQVDIENLNVQLFLEPGSGIDVIDRERPDASTAMSNVHVGSSKRWTHIFHLKSQRPGQGEAVNLAARVKFHEVSASQDVSCLLPRPNLVDLKVIAAHRYDESKPSYGAEESLSQGSVMRLYPNRDSSFKLMLQNYASDDKKVRVQLIRVPRQTFVPDVNRPQPWSPYLFGEGRALISELQDLDAQLAKMQTLPAFLAEQVVAASPEKTPIVLPSANSPLVPVTLELKNGAPVNPANPAATPPPVDVTTGLLCVITNVEKPSERFIKWLDLVPYAPHELFELREKDISFVDGMLSFKVTLFAADAAAGMRLDQPLKVIWDRTGTGLGKPDYMESIINPQTLSATFKAEIPEAIRQDVVLRLNIDDYPRAFVYGLQLDNKIQVISPRNLKRDQLSGLHLSRLTHDKTMFLIQSQDAVYTPAVVPETVPPDLVLKYLRREERSIAGIRLDTPGNRQKMTADLQADVHSSFFTDGGWIELGYEGAEPKYRFLQDRDIKVTLEGLLTDGGLTFHTTVDDFRGLDVATDASPPDDTRTRLKASLKGGKLDLSSDAANHVQTVVFDRKAPLFEVEALLVKNRIQIDYTRRTDLIEVLGRVTDGQGVGIQTVKVTMSREPDGKVVPEGIKPVVLETMLAPDGTFRATRVVPTGLPPGTTRFNIDVQPIDLVSREGTPQTLQLEIVTPAPRVNITDRPSFTPEVKKKADEEATKKKVDDFKKNFPGATPPPPGAP
ncbi:hypothetical protein ETAA8_33520 [Anatilimnocola aggregata]|uniref:Uncharacterized protein n=1 Tax=Anatilimnocola aggregata TaxID=2528021 RepID=A0A517YDN5_9BACT|nr:hypothetical protein [Anatilimnocola aggregata]QDU28252.1 hypothetical protein ETAA8_33520 [Anatilimnocola aggregata]